MRDKSGALRATEDLIFFPADHLPALARHFQVQTTPGQRSEGCEASVRAKIPVMRHFLITDGRSECGARRSAVRAVPAFEAARDAESP
ncbi:MAG TPA: hypothetical protein PKK76_17315 [Leptospiraceae bacterium]|nr:hypothetical protein [Leptospiraceae bacterium]